MLIRVYLIVGLIALGMSGKVFGAVHELSQVELRHATSSGKTIHLKRAIFSVAEALGGQPVEARAFRMQEIYYRILVKKPNGQILSVILNAETGATVSKDSALARQVAEAAKSSAPTLSGATKSAK